MVEYYDVEFAKIQGLKWLPWVGKYYKTIENSNKLLIIGESHYHDKTEHSIEKHNSIIFSREVIKELAIDRNYYETKIFQNLHKALFGNDKFNSELFWNFVTFYNFIQRPMETNQGRPSYDDYYQGWKIFFEIIKIIKPNICLFIGTTSANYLLNAIPETGFKSTQIRWEEKISNAYAKTSILTSNENENIKTIFIKHTSKMFSWSKWNKYLNKTMPSFLKWIDKIVSR